MLALSAATPALAQQDPSASTSQDGQEIVVTAQKREERLIETPQAVSVLSADTLDNLAAVQFRDFANTVPGLTFESSGSGFNQVTIRGVTTGYQVTPTVGVVVDDVPYGSTSAFARAAQLSLDAGLFDVDRIEVLRGPQGTLYGASTMGGLIKYVNRMPSTDTFGGEAQAGVSTTRHGGINYNVAGAVNVPIAADKAALRASAYQSHDGGYVDNIALGRKDVDRSDTYGGRLDLLLTPTEGLSIRVTGFAQNIDRDGAPTVDFTIGGRPVNGDLQQERPLAEPFEQQFRLVSGTIAYDFGGATATSISSYQTVRSSFSVSDSPALVPVLATFFGRNYSAVNIQNRVATDKFNQEIRLASNGKSSIEWLVGGYYTSEDSNNLQYVDLLLPSGQLDVNDLFRYETPSKYEEIAAFGNVTVRLSDKFDISGGLRYSHLDQTYTQFGSGALIGSFPKNSSSDDVTTYLANARYHFSRNATAYFRFATGYRPGGPNVVAPGAPTSFQPDELKSYELGFKAETADRKLGIDMAAYYIDWTNLQILTTTATGVSYYANSPAPAEIKGVELTLTARPTRGFVATGAFAWQDAELTDNFAGLGAAKGDPLPNVPRFTAAVSADYKFDAGTISPSFGFTLRAIDKRNASFDANPFIAQYRLPAYATLDLRAGIEIGGVDLTVYARNLFDERAQLTNSSGVSSLTGPVEVSILQPRTIGILAKARF
nr:TonB-dependent receptor [Sphingomonas sp. Y57]